MSKRHSKKRSGSYCEDNVITKYFRRSESLEQSIGSDDISNDGNAGNDVILIDTESDDETENFTENTTSICSTSSLCDTSVASRETTSSLVGSDQSVEATVPGKDTNSISTLSSEFNDIGHVIHEGMSVEEVSRAVLALSPCQKYLLLTKHFKPDKGFLFPKMYSNGCNRSFQLSWLEKYPWLVYSKEVDGGFCKYCSLFVKDRNSLGALVNSPFRKWVKVSKIVKGHKDTLYHKISIECAIDFRQSINRPELSINARISTEIFNRIQENRHILKCCANCIIYCGKQCIALRGDCENLEKLDRNPGNFLSMLKVLANYDPTLKKHLDKPRQRNATYLSPHTQNELIDIIGKKIIQSDIVREIQKAICYSIMIDEVTSHNKEIMPVCIRFVDKNKNIREEFLQFTQLTRVTGEAIAKQLFSDLKDLNIDIKKIRGQGYDGAKNMSSERVGVQAYVKKVSPLAVYTHCSGHCLNLVISHSCTLPSVRNVLDRMTSVCLFFLNSPKRNELLIEIVTKNVHQDNRRKALIDLCKTRWAQRHSAYQHFYQSYVFIVQCFEVISMGLHVENLSDNFATATWDHDTKGTANSLLKGLTDFEFIMVFLIAYQLLSHLSGITVKLQSTTVDIVDAYQKIDEVKGYYREIRKNIDTQFHVIYEQAERMANAVNTNISRPRNCRRQMHRPNAYVEGIEEWYRINVAVPFLDHIISELNAQFSSLAQTASKLYGMIPAILCSGKNVDLTEVVELYNDDMPSPELFQQELERWKTRYLSKANSDRPSTCAKALAECDEELFPNIYVLLVIACTLPVTSCECERNASVLRRLNNFMRASMNESRLTSLALMHIHYDKIVDLDRVVDLFSQAHPRRIQLSTVLFETATGL